MKDVSATLADESIPVVEIDCVKDLKFCASLDVVSYPAVRIFQGPETWQRYRGKMTAQS